MTWNADPLEVQAGAVADGKSRMLLKTVRATGRAFLLLTDLLTMDLDDPGSSWNKYPPATPVSRPH
jgi:hypothetical protein